MNYPKIGFIRGTVLSWCFPAQYSFQDGDVVVVLLTGVVATNLPPELVALFEARAPRRPGGSSIPPEFPFASMGTKPEESYGLMLCLAVRDLRDLNQIRFVVPRRWPRPLAEEGWSGWSTYDAVKLEEHFAYANDGLIIVVGGESALSDWYFALNSVTDAGCQGLTGRMLLAAAAAQVLSAPFDRYRSFSSSSINTDSEFLGWLEEYSKGLEDGLAPSSATHVPDFDLGALQAASTAHTRLCGRLAEYCREGRLGIDLLADGSTLPPPVAARVRQSGEVLDAAVRRLEQAGDSSRRARDAGVALGSLLAAQTANSIAHRAAVFGWLALCLGLLSVIVGFWGMNFEFFRKNGESEQFHAVIGSWSTTNAPGLGIKVTFWPGKKEGVLPSKITLKECEWFYLTVVAIFVIAVGFGGQAWRTSRQRHERLGGTKLPKPLRF